MVSIQELYEYGRDHLDDYFESTVLPQFTENSYAEWLTNGEWSQGKFALYLAAKQLPVIGPYTDFVTSFYDDTSYLNNNQLSWDQVRRPWKLSSSNAGARFIGSAYNFVSHNIDRLYK